MTPKMKHRNVVSNFFIKLRDDEPLNPKVALFKRSGEVRTYCHKLAPVSGSIDDEDTSPLAAAYREINEETGLNQSCLTLYRRGQPYTFADESIHRSWTIYPFAFTLKDGSEEKIRLDWEHEGWGWYDAKDVNDDDEFGGVPKLRESLRRAIFEIDLPAEMGTILHNGLAKLQNDHESGARQLAGHALAILRDTIEASEISPSEQTDLWTQVKDVGWHLWKNGRPSMNAAILSAVISALSRIKRDLDDDSQFTSAKECCLQVLDQIVALRLHTSERIATEFTKVLTSKIGDIEPSTDGRTHLSLLTLSSSSTLRYALLKAIDTISHTHPGVTFDIRILESRPLNEGVSLANGLHEALQGSLSSERNSVTISLFTDASVAYAARGIHFLVLGADRISATGDVSNKTGSWAAAMAAKFSTEDAKVVVLSELEKVSEIGSQDSEYSEEEENDPLEVARAWEGDSAQAMKRFGVRNTYFEWVKRDSIDQYVCEEGIFTQEKIVERSGWIKYQIGILFGDGTSTS